MLLFKKLLNKMGVVGRWVSNGPRSVLLLLWHAILNYQLLVMSCSVYSNSMSWDLKNVGIDVEITLLSGLGARF